MTMSWRFPAGYPLAERLQSVLHRPVTTTNDAQAAAWGEHRFGAGEGRDMVFVTISTGVGGGIVTGGRLLGGIAGSIGQIVDMQAPEAGPVEDHCSGKWIERAAGRAGRPGTAADVFAAAADGAEWAETIVRTASERAAVLMRTLHLLLDPPRIVVGGGVGLAHGFLDRVERQLDGLSSAPATPSRRRRDRCCRRNPGRRRSRPVSSAQRQSITLEEPTCRPTAHRD